MTTKPTLDDLKCKRCRRAVAYPGAVFCGAACCALWEAGDPGLPPPWLSRGDRIGFAVWCLFLAALVAIVFALTPGCSFPAEGTPLVGCEGCYRPPHPDGVHLPQASSTATSSPTSSDPTESGEAESTTSEAESSGAPTDSDSSSGSSGGGPSADADTGQDSGEPEVFEPAHCDMTCPAGDAIEPTGEQAANPGTDQGCYCATPCESDDDCGGLEHCEPFFGRCTIACMSGADCDAMNDNDPEAVTTCTLWWNAADDFVHFCTYAYEDAP